MPPPINLLPREIAARARDRRITQAMIGGAAVVVALLVMGTFVARAREAREKEILAEELARTTQVRAEVARLKQFEELEKRVIDRRGLLATAMTNDIAWSKLLNDVSLILPDNSWLTSLTLAGGTAGTAPNGVASFGNVGFAGVVFDMPGLAGWLTRMNQIDGLTFVYLGTGAKADLLGRPIVNFTASGQITAASLSQRCQTGQRCP